MATSLPFDILSLIFILATSSITTSTSNATLTINNISNLKNFSLVCSSWTYSAQSKLIRSIEIKTRRRLIELTNSLGVKEGGRNRDLNSIIRSLSLGSGRTIIPPVDSTNSNLTDAIVQSDSITELEFIDLVKCLPELVELKLQRISCFNFSSLLPPNTLPLLPNLETLTLNTSPFDETQDLLAFLLFNSPSLNDLNLIGISRGPFSLVPTRSIQTKFPTITSLRVIGPYYEYILFSPSTPLLPHSFYQNLQILDIEGKFDWRGLSPILRAIGGNLKEFRLRSVAKAADLIRELEWLTNLSTLQTTTLIGLPAEDHFMLRLPISLQNLRVIITRANLELYFKHHQSNSTISNLVEIFLPDNDIEAIKFLPNSVRKVIYRQGFPYRFLEFLEKNYNKPLSNSTSTQSGEKNTLYLDELVLPKYRSLDNEWENTVLKFKEFGVKLSSGTVVPREGDII